MMLSSKFSIMRIAACVCESLTHVFQMTGSAFQHLTSLLFLCFCICFVNWIFGTTGNQSHLHPLVSYGYIGCVLLYSLRFIPYLSLPFCITNVLGNNVVFTSVSVVFRTIHLYKPFGMFLIPFRKFIIKLNSYFENFSYDSSRPWFGR